MMVRRHGRADVVVGAWFGSGAATIVSLALGNLFAHLWPQFILQTTAIKDILRKSPRHISPLGHVLREGRGPMERATWMGRRLELMYFSQTRTTRDLHHGLENRRRGEHATDMNFCPGPQRQLNIRAPPIHLR